MDTRQETQRDEPATGWRRVFRRYGPSWWVRLFGLSILNGLVLALIPTLAEQGSWIALVSMVIGVLGIDYVFVSSRAYPLRYLVPGLVFLALLMIWPIIFTVIVALTNWSTGNFITEEQAVNAITSGNRYLVESDESPIVELALYRDESQADPLDQSAGLLMLVRTEAGSVFAGTPRLRSDPVPEEPELLDLEGATIVDEDGDGLPESVDGANRLTLRQISSVNDVLDALVLDIPGRGQARARTFSSAVLAEQRFTQDGSVLVDNVNGGTCEAVEGTFVCANGDRLDPGFRAFIGFDNFTDIVNNPRVRAPFVRVFIWNLLFAAFVVAIQLVIGLGLAMTLNEPRMKGKAIYRSLLLIPYAAPAFISIIVWRGLLNQTFGPLNALIDPLVMLFRDEAIPWLTDPFYAKVAVILVSVWQGFAYFFLISTGALQSIPSDIIEAGKVDGASGPQVFRRITFPLLMVGIAPLIIASYAFNFNAFVNIFLLTAGGPPITGYAVPVGETDILISYTFNLAIESGRGGQLALAAANTFFIFFIVAGLAAVSFRFTKRLETIYGNL